MKKYMITLTVVFLTVWFTSCSDEGDASFKNGVTVISLVGVDCVTTPTSTDIANYTTLLSGDTIVKDDDNATISIYHDANGTKKICLINNGSSAHLLR
ncbi:hypothetical protein [Candidatus Sulfurimonas baltica]|uniref:Uncharacterized protein n=1 Tax=Candidatus Sulfurimonas baltica TaxID=2740404 RepID=A0A7S7LTD2_9BACT|nr:hypothetical protein [Candidatus Sulfurimonas baltica]QOY51008.1 hypothetical protein HUE88_07595 [Candidatus Sulfurimonas baltica]